MSNKLKAVIMVITEQQKNEHRTAKTQKNF